MREGLEQHFPNAGEKSEESKAISLRRGLPLEVDGTDEMDKRSNIEYCRDDVTFWRASSYTINDVN